MRLHFKRVNLDSPKYKPSSYPRVKCTPCLLSLGLATGAASSACRFLQKDWAPLRTGLLLMPFVTMTESQMHTRTHAHTHPHTDMSWGMLESRALLNYSAVIPTVTTSQNCLIYVDLGDSVSRSQLQLVMNWLI